MWALRTWMPTMTILCDAKQTHYDSVKTSANQISSSLLTQTLGCCSVKHELLSVWSIQRVIHISLVSQESLFWPSNLCVIYLTRLYNAFSVFQANQWTESSIECHSQFRTTRNAWWLLLFYRPFSTVYSGAVHKVRHARGGKGGPRGCDSLWRGRG